MGKITFRRVREVQTRSKITAALPIVGGLLFLCGSIAFCPGIFATDDLGAEAGATLFLAGSVLFFAVPVLDYWDMTTSIERLTTFKDGAAAEAGKDAGADAYERLYKAQLLRTQRANALLYAVSGASFIGGSCLFYPSMHAITAMHGAWLYLLGCVVGFLGAFLAASTAYELRKTAESSSYPRDSCLNLYCWTDEAAQIVSCSLYMVGNVLFLAGSIFFFPPLYVASQTLDAHLFVSVPLAGAVNVTVNVVDDDRFLRAAVGVFVAGSLFFIIGATIDLLALLRSHRRQPAVNEASTLMPAKA